MQYYSSAKERDEHMAECQGIVLEDSDEADAASSEPAEVEDPSLTVYECDVCKKRLRLRPIDVLKHKRACR